MSLSGCLTGSTRGHGHIHGQRALFEKRTRGPPQGCAGGQRVIHKQNGFAPNRGGRGERPAQIGLAFGAVQPNLMAGGPGAAQQGGRQRRARRDGQRAGQLLALIEAALAQAGGVQRHRHDRVRRGQIRACLREKPADQMQYSRIMPEFAPEQERSEHARIGRVKPELSPGRRRDKAIAARRARGRSQWKKLTATGAAAVAVRPQRRAAVRAQGQGRRDLSAR